jgi:hypothetical protein
MIFKGIWSGTKLIFKHGPSGTTTVGTYEGAVEEVP